MILAAGLSFLGLGTKPPEPEWGLMLNTLRTAIYANPWVAALPRCDDLCGVDLLQPAERRHAQRHGYKELTAMTETSMPVEAGAGRGSRRCRAAAA
jgi:hypothetical protein